MDGVGHSAAKGFGKGAGKELGKHITGEHKPHGHDVSHLLHLDLKHLPGPGEIPDPVSLAAKTLLDGGLKHLLTAPGQPLHLLSRLL
jgi:hypothetical protein